jgi:multicomponent Na+:H+ antiporter subunit G
MHCVHEFYAELDSSLRWNDNGLQRSKPMISLSDDPTLTDLFAYYSELTLYGLGWVAIFLGVFFILTGALGLIRMPDFYTRLHAAGLIDSMGAPLLLIGLAIHDGFTLVTVKIILLIIFLLITSPTATHALAKAALLAGLKPDAEVKE